MKKPTAFIVVIAVIAAGVGYAYWSHVNEIRQGPQGEPVRCVETFMGTAQKISALLWDEQVRDELKADLRRWTSAKEEGERSLPESLEQYGLHDPDTFFKKERFGRATVSALCLFHFTSYDVQPARIGSATASVDVTFTPLDVLGLRRLTTSLGVPQQAQEPKPVRARFRLRKYGHAWYIDGIEGELSQAISAFGRLR